MYKSISVNEMEQLMNNFEVDFNHNFTSYLKENYGEDFKLNYLNISANLTERGIDVVFEPFIEIDGEYLDFTGFEIMHNVNELAHNLSIIFFDRGLHEYINKADFYDYFGTYLKIKEFETVKKYDLINSVLNHLKEYDGDIKDFKYGNEDYYSREVISSLLLR
ncbi:hypothetical protein K5E_11130 [Enterococcus thailandicus]|uniref:hypothetical protein n=1 Tax=Enterococcus thailandicus TaxID=417368 RepID=UPI00244D7D64|nr:hypothetical protein [Enterococcus thailandicus]GMC02589.1 hypothetical protein K4E_00990 [Enterococcus thailandicus]GMC08974.1 hypothetical protein K5E_11130 [Enterococcus thailandicus]